MKPGSLRDFASLRTDVTDCAIGLAAAQEHETWFRAQVDAALSQEDQNVAIWHSHDDVWADVMKFAEQEANQAGAPLESSSAK
jgi:hypothetical protein